MEYEFNADKVKKNVIADIRDWFNKNGEGCNAVVGISGGKDSSVVAALCVQALGSDRVIGVLMPNIIQEDIRYSRMLVKLLGIRSLEVDIGSAVCQLSENIAHATINSKKFNNGLSEQARINLPARIRMATLYAVSQSNNGRVMNTCNLSENWVGYATRYGDAAGDYSPLAYLTTDEVIAVGESCGLPKRLTRKTPTDGLCDKTDEDNLGFTYEILNKYIRTGVCEDKEIKEKIDYMHKKNLFKLKEMPAFVPDGLRIAI